MADSDRTEVEQMPSSAPSTKRKCTPEQLERLAKAREKALEKRAALACLRHKEKELADLALQERFRKAERLEREFKDRKSKAKQRAPPARKQQVESASSSEAEESEEEYEEPPPPKREPKRKPARYAHARLPLRADPQEEWMQIARRVFPGL